MVVNPAEQKPWMPDPRVTEHQGQYICDDELVTVPFIKANFKNHQDFYPPQFLWILRKYDHIVGVVDEEGNTVISPAPDHPHLMEVIESSGISVGANTAHLEISKIGDLTWPYNDDPKFDQIFIQSKNLELIIPTARFLGVDREWPRRIKAQINRRYNNLICDESIAESKAVEEATWMGIFSPGTRVIITDYSTPILNGSLVSISLDNFLKTYKQQEVEMIPQSKKFAMAFDPVTGRIAFGEGHDDAATRLGFSNGHGMLLENWDEHALRYRNRFERPTVRVRNILLPEEVGYIKILAFSLIEKGFPDDMYINFEVRKGEMLITKTVRIKEILGI